VTNDPINRVDPHGLEEYDSSTFDTWYGDGGGNQGGGGNGGGGGGNGGGGSSPSSPSNGSSTPVAAATRAAQSLPVTVTDGDYHMVTVGYDGTITIAFYDNTTNAQDAVMTYSPSGQMTDIAVQGTDFGNPANYVDALNVDQADASVLAGDYGRDAFNANALETVYYSLSVAAFAEDNPALGYALYAAGDAEAGLAYYDSVEASNLTTQAANDQTWINWVNNHKNLN
jgi:hypothetical protein